MPVVKSVVLLYKRTPMPIRIIPDEHQPSVAVEIPLGKPLPDYDLEEMDKPTPREVDGILVTQGFRDLVDDARGVLMEVLAGAPAEPISDKPQHVELTPAAGPPLEIAQLTGAICPADQEVYRPGLWIVLHDHTASPKHGLTRETLDRIGAAARELVKRLQLE